MSRFACNRRGSAAIETGLCAAALVALIAGSVDAARFYFASQSLRSLTAEAARLALTDDALSGCGAPAEALQARAPGVARNLLVPGATLCVTREAVAGLTRLTVQATRPFEPAVPGLRHLPRSLEETTVLSY
jgi:Flp pilus assembly protein TadG